MSAAAVEVTPAHRGPVGLTIAGLSAGYDGSGTEVLGELSFELPPGSRLSIVGASGCGKSTLLNVLAGVLAPVAGAVEAGGRTVAGADLDGPGRPGCRSGHAAYMFQSDLLLPWRTVLGNATLAAGAAAGRAGRSERAAREARARAVLAELGLGDVCDARPDQLSGGMRQRAALARTLVAGKGLVLLDEPFGSLDTLTRAELRVWLLEAMRAHPATWVLVTHDVREAVLLGDVVAVLGGRPARLHGWLETEIDEDVRLQLAAREAGSPAAAGQAEAPPAAGQAAGNFPSPGSPRPVAAGASALDAADVRVRALTAEVLALLMARRDA